MQKLDPRLDCILEMTEAERRTAVALARKRRGLDVAAVERDTGSSVTVRVFIRLADEAGHGGPLRIPGVRERARSYDLVTADVTPEGLAALNSHPEVLYVERAKPLLPSVAAPARQAKIDIAPGPLEQTGQGVIVGIIDWGCDFTHEDFRNDDGSSRLLYLWDESASGGPGRHRPKGYDYGTEFSRDEINQALKAPAPFEALGVEPPGVGAHGTHVMGIAAGNGRANPSAGVRGIAPQADLIFVQPDTEDVNIVGGFGDSVHLAEAIKYVFDKASELRRPAVINLSMGTNSGPHDGSSLVEQWMDRLLGVPGRAVVLALGNEHHERFNRTHSEGRLGPGETMTLYWRVLPNDFSPNEIEIWYSGRDLFHVELELPGGSRLPVARPGQTITTQIPHSDTRVYQANLLNSPLNGDNQIDIIVIGSDTQPIEQGVWQLHLSADVAVEGTFDAWIERDSMQAPARMSSFIGGSYIRRKTLGSLQSARFAITVSNYDALTTTLADSTSFGPTRDGRRAPAVAAPGTDVLSTKSMWQTDPNDRSPYIRMTGTSMSAPYVTGLVACMFQKNPLLTAVQVRSLLASQAKPAPGFSSEWRIDWGHGRADPVDTLNATPPVNG